MGGFKDMVFGGGGDEAAAAAKRAAGISSQAQMASLEYLKEREAIPQAFREQALMELGSIYGLPGLIDAEIGMLPGYSPLDQRKMGGAISEIFEAATSGEEAVGMPETTGVPPTAYAPRGQEGMIERAISDPLYQTLLAGREAGEEAIMRSAGATGGLRSGGTQEALYDYNTQLQNRALLESYNRQLAGLTGMANLPSMTPQIASGMAGIGATQAQGITAAAQAQEIAKQQQMSNLMGLGQLGITAAMFSDRRLKKNIEKIAEINGFNWYSFDWNSAAKKLGLSGSTYGTMADEVYDVMPEAVMLKDNFMMVNYAMIGVL